MTGEMTAATLRIWSHDSGTESTTRINTQDRRVEAKTSCQNKFTMFTRDLASLIFFSESSICSKLWCSDMPATQLLPQAFSGGTFSGPSFCVGSDLKANDGWL